MNDALLINPNTTASVTDQLASRIRAGLPDGVPLRACTAPFGAPYISDEASYVVGAHAVLSAFKAQVEADGAPSWVLVGCFGDPGVHALRSLTDAPCMGLAEAALRHAATQWKRVAVVTAGPAWGPMLRRFYRGLDGVGDVASIDTLPHAVADLLRDPQAGCEVLAEAVRRAARQADGVILGGAGLAPLSARVRERAGVPLLDSVDAGAAWLAAQVRGKE